MVVIIVPRRHLEVRHTNRSTAGKDLDSHCRRDRHHQQQQSTVTIITIISIMIITHRVPVVRRTNVSKIGSRAG
jgi:hypothetical protein